MKNKNPSYESQFSSKSTLRRATSFLRGPTRLGDSPTGIRREVSFRRENEQSCSTNHHQHQAAKISLDWFAKIVFLDAFDLFLSREFLPRGARTTETPRIGLSFERETIQRPVNRSVRVM